MKRSSIDILKQTAHHSKLPNIVSKTNHPVSIQLYTSS